MCYQLFRLHLFVPSTAFLIIFQLVIGPVYVGLIYFSRQPVVNVFVLQSCFPHRSVRGIGLIWLVSLTVSISCGTCECVIGSRSFLYILFTHNWSISPYTSWWIRQTLIPKSVTEDHLYFFYQHCGIVKDLSKLVVLPASGRHLVLKVQATSSSILRHLQSFRGNLKRRCEVFLYIRRKRHSVDLCQYNLNQPGSSFTLCKNIKMRRTKYSCKLKSLQSYSGGEYVGKEFRTFFSENGNYNRPTCV